MSQEPQDNSKLSDEKLESIYNQICHEDPAASIDQNILGARQALELIARVRAAARNETAKTNETLFDDGTKFNSQFDQPNDSLPSSIGRFAIKKPLGKGGFGMVFLANDPNLDRDIALKIPRPEAITTPDLKARFIREGRSAAALSHPNIVPVYESGQIGSICYLASQFVDGESLDDWAARQSETTPKQIAEICQAIAEGLAHAHQRGVLHRDIKPGNILVAAPKADASDAANSIANRIQITDFGLAKNVGDDSSQTQTGALIGTPSYMSPEQASQVSSTESSDIYSAGTVLYFLLTGKPPFAGSNIVETIQDVIKTEPVAPTKLSSTVPADLEAICLKCLEKSPTARYATAFDLAADLNRFRNGEPVHARTISQLDRLVRWTRRNPQIAATIALISVVLVGSMIWINHERNLALDEAVRATQSAQRSQNVLQIVMNSFENLSPYDGGSSEMTALDVLIQAKDSLGMSELDDIGRGLLLTTIADCLTDMSQYELAIEAAKEAVQLQHQAQGPEHPDTLAALFSQAVAVRWSGEVEMAVPMYLEVLNVREKNLGPDHTLTVDTRGAIAAAYHELGRMEESLEMFEEIYESRERTLGVDDESTVSTMINLGVLYKQAGRLDDALSTAFHVVSLQKKSLGHEHPETLDSMAHLGKIYEGKELHEESLEMHQTVHRHRTKTLGPDHLDTHTSAYEVARALAKLGRYDQAIELFMATIEAFSKQAGPEKYETLITQANLAQTLQQLDRHEEAIELFRHVAQTRRETKGPQHRLTLFSQTELARAFRKAGRLEEAIELLEETMGAQREVIGAEHGNSLQTQNELAIAHEQAGNLKLAMSLLNEVQAIRKNFPGNNHPVTAQGSFDLARIMLKNRKFGEAESLLNDYLDYLGPDYPNRWKLFHAKSLLGESMMQQGDLDESFLFLLTGYEGLSKSKCFQSAGYRTRVLREAVERLIDHAKSVGDSAAANDWRRGLTDPQIQESLFSKSWN